MEDAKAALPKESAYSKGLRRLRKGTGSCLFYLKSLGKAVKACRADAVLVEGKEIHSGQPVKVFYFGAYANYHWILKTIFSEFRIKEITKNIFMFNAEKWARKYEKESDLVVLDPGEFYGKMLKYFQNNYICVPDWIGQKREMGNSRKDLFSSFKAHRTKMRHINRIMKDNVTYRIVDAEEDFKDFYHNYYLPFTSKRFGNTAITEKEARFLRRCRDGKVMQILHGSDGIAYSLMEMEPGRLVCRMDGISQDIDDELHSVTYNALYYYSLIYGFENGCDVVDYMYTRPLLTGGIYKYKRTWGCDVYSYPDWTGKVFIRPASFSGSTIDIFSNNYFVTSKNNKLVAKILCGDGELSVQFIEHVMKNYSSKGIDVLRIYSLKKVAPEVVAWSRENAPPVEVMDLSGERNPQEVFCM